MRGAGGTVGQDTRRGKGKGKSGKGSICMMSYGDRHKRVDYVSTHSSCSGVKWLTKGGSLMTTMGIFMLHSKLRFVPVLFEIHT